MPPTLKQLIRQPPEYKASVQRWQRLAALVDGASSLTDDIKRQILANPDSRPSQVIAERVKVARYFNKIGPIINRFLSQLFATPAQFEGSHDRWWSETFFPGGAMLPGDSDGRCSFNSFLRAAMLQALSTGRAIAQIDTSIAEGVLTKAEQRSRKTDEPYVLLVPRWDLWDCSTDITGFRFAKIHKFNWVRDSWDSTPIAEHDFTIYQRQPEGKVLASRYTVRLKNQESLFDQGGEAGNLNNLDDKDVDIQVVNGLENREIFNLKGEYQFPVVSLTLPKALFIADQLYDPQVSHFNQTASLEYGLVASNYASLAITSSDIEDFTQRNDRFGAGYYIHLDPSNQDAVSWIERPGGAFETSMDYRERIVGDIDRSLQQIALSAADAVTSQSGVAIVQARRPEQILLSTYGSLVKEFSLSILNASAIARGESVQWKINGFDEFAEFDLTELTNEYNLIQQAQIPSQTFTKEIQKSYVRDVAKEKEIETPTLKKIVEEIDQAPAQAPSGDDASEQDAGTGDDNLDDNSGNNSGDTANDSDSTNDIASSVLSDPKLLKQLGI